MMFPIAEAFVERSILVSDDDIIAAQKALWDRVRIISEPGGAAAFAAILSGRYAPAAGRTRRRAGLRRQREPRDVLICNHCGRGFTFSRTRLAFAVFAGILSSS